MRLGIRSTRRINLITGLLLLVAIVLAGIWFGLGSGRNTNPTLAARDTAVAAAQQTALNFTAYDYSKIDQQFAVVQKELAGDALSDFTKNKTTIKTFFTQGKVVSTSRILDSATVSNSPREATVLVSVQVTFVQGSSTGARLSLVQMHLVRNGTRWAVDELPPVT
jgi:hypothetical protein